jgi:hypothetical protein
MRLISKGYSAIAPGVSQSATHEHRRVSIPQPGNHSVSIQARQQAAATSHLLRFAAAIAGSLAAVCAASAADTANPAVVAYSLAVQERLYAFVGTPNGHLDLDYWNGSAWHWTDQGLPPGTMVSDSPGIITYPQAGQQRTYVFARTSNGHLNLNYYDGIAWHWADQGVPPGSTVADSPGVVTYSQAGSQRIYAFVRDSNSHLDLNYWNGSAWQWTDQGLPPGTTVADAPGAVTYLQAGQQRTYAFVRTSNGHLSVNYYDGIAWHWADQGVPPGTVVTDVPAVITYLQAGLQRIYVFVKGANGHLNVNYFDGFTWHWADQGVPPGTNVADVPGVITYVQAGVQRLYAFVRCTNGHLGVNYYDGSAWHWADQGVPPGTTMIDAPGVFTYLDAAKQRIYCFVRGANYHLNVNYWDGAAWRWADQGVPPDQGLQRP